MSLGARQLGSFQLGGGHPAPAVLTGPRLPTFLQLKDPALSIQLAKRSTGATLRTRTTNAAIRTRVTQAVLQARKTNVQIGRVTDITLSEEKV